VLGHEASGIVEQVGTGVTARQRDRLQLDGQPFRQYLGVSALAELMLVDAGGLIPSPTS